MKVIKILIIQSPHYDFSGATLIEGLHILQAKGEVEVFTAESSNYASGLDYSHQLANDADILQYGRETADLVVKTSNQAVRSDLVESIDRPEKTVFIDGEDTHPYIEDPKKYPLYFKREMRLDVDHPKNVKPFPFAIENRYIHNPNEWEDRKFDVACMFGPHDSTKPWRREIEDKLNDMDLENSVIGQLYGGVPDRQDIDTGNRDHPDYYNVLALSKIAVDAHGAHECNSARFWESLACGCLLVTRRNLIHMPHPFENGIHMFEFQDPLSLGYIIPNLLKDDTTMQKIANEALVHAMNFHTTEARVNQFLSECYREGLINK